MFLFWGREAHSRSFAKAVSWRVTGTIDTFVISGHLEQWSILPRGGTTSGAVCNLIAVFHRFFCGRCFGQNCRGPSPLCGGHPLQDYQPPQVVDEVL